MLYPVVFLVSPVAFAHTVVPPWLRPHRLQFKSFAIYLTVINLPHASYLRDVCRSASISSQSVIAMCRQHVPSPQTASLIVGHRRLCHTTERVQHQNNKYMTIFFIPKYRFSLSFYNYLKRTVRPLFRAGTQKDGS